MPDVTIKPDANLPLQWPYLVNTVAWQALRDGSIYTYIWTNTLVQPYAQFTMEDPPIPEGSTITQIGTVVQARAVGKGVAERIQVLTRFDGLWYTKGPQNVARGYWESYWDWWATKPDGTPITLKDLIGMACGVQAYTLGSDEELHVAEIWQRIFYTLPVIIEKSDEETYPIYEVSGGFKTPHVMPKIFAPVPIAIHSGTSFVMRNNEIPHERKARDMGRNPIILTTNGKKAHRALREIRPRYGFKVIRGGEVVYRRWEGADLLVWRGQMSLAYLISQGSTGSAVGAFMLVASENDTMPDMGHDSGDPEANEFSPVIGTPITGTWWFEPTVKPTGQYQLSGWLFYEGDVVADRDCTLRKMGIIDTTPTPNRRIITEDRAVDVPILLNDLIRIRYFFPLG